MAHMPAKKSYKTYIPANSIRMWPASSFLSTSGVPVQVMGVGWELNAQSAIVVIADREPVTMILEKLKGPNEAASSQGLPTRSPGLERQRKQVCD